MDQVFRKSPCRLFSISFTVRNESRNKLTGGSGLGLSIAKMIIEEHNGTIQVESTLMVGTKMTIIIAAK